MKVCLVAPLPPPYGGIGHWTQLVLRYAAARAVVRFDVVDIAPRWRALHDLGIGKRVVGGGLQFLRDLARFLWLLVWRRPDTIHLTTPGQLAVVRDNAFAAFAKAFRIPLVYHLRFGRIPEIAEANTREWRLLRRAMLAAACVIPIDSETEAAIRRHAPGATVTRIPNCIDPSELPAPSPGASATRTAMFLGWVIPTKGVGELVEAWARLAPEGWRLLVAGPGDEAYRSALLARHRPLGVEFVGELEHAAAMRELAAADVLVLPSYTEGFPNVVLEAMTLGKAIVATQVGAIPEMLSRGSGITVPARDVDALTEALRRVIGSTELRAEIGARAQARALAEYSIDAVFERYKRIWEGKAVP